MIAYLINHELDEGEGRKMFIDKFEFIKYENIPLVFHQFVELFQINFSQSHGKV